MIKKVTEKNKVYFIETERLFYKIKEDGTIYKKLKKSRKKVNRFCKIKNKHNQISFGYTSYNKKKFLYEIFNNTKLKENETVYFKNNDSNDFSKENLGKKKKTANFFRNIDDKIIHYNYKNEKIGEYKSQNDASANTNFKQTRISANLRKKILRLSDYSYFIYEGDTLLNRYRDYNSCGMNTIVQMDEKNNVINKFKNAQDAVNILDLSKNAESSIIKCCKRKRRMAYGYKWAYISLKNRKRLKKMVIRYDSNNNPIEVYRNRKLACKNIPINKGILSRILNGKYKPHKYNLKEVSYNTGICTMKRINKRKRLKNNIYETN